MASTVEPVPAASLAESTATSGSATAASSSARLESVDALRGFDMLWIIGGATLGRALQGLAKNDFTQFAATQLEHAPWEGFRFYDLIFPLFLFIVGISIVFSLDKALAAGGRVPAIARILRRSVLLYLLGVFYSGGLSQPWPAVGLGGVLQRIAACYLCAAVLYCFVRRGPAIAAVAGVLLAGYWALLTFVPFPDLKLDKAHVQAVAQRIGSDSPFAIAGAVSERTHGSYEEGRNLTNYVDFLFLPGKKAQSYYINEGLLSTLPAIALPLFGILAGRLLRSGTTSPSRKVLWLLLAGAASLAVGLAWTWQFPCIKRIWTSSFVLIAAGCSAWLLALFYWLVDVRGWRTWCRPFVWIGSNAITLYLAWPLVGFPAIAARLAGGDVHRLLDEHVAKGTGDVVLALLSLLLVVLLARFLYVRRIFLRV